MALNTASLTKFTVPPGAGIASSGLLMPKLKFRFRARFDNFGVAKTTTEMTKQIMTFQRPTVDFAPIEIPVYNSRVYIAGRPLWTAVNTTMRDDAGGNVSRMIGEQLQKQFDFMEQASASAGIDYKFTTTLEMLDGGNGNSEPVVLETWQMYGCFLTNVNYNDVDYNANDPVTITMSIRYDNALQTTGVGDTVQRGTGTVITG